MRGPSNIIAVGYKAGDHIHVICDEAGFNQLPEPMEFYTDGGGNLPIGAKIAFTDANLVALSLMGVLSSNDISGMRKWGST